MSMKAVLSFCLICLFFVGNAQSILDPVKWTFGSEKVGDNEYKITFTATIEDGWAVYSQFIEDGGPIPTTFNFDENTDIELKDGVVEPEDKETKYDEMFEMDLIKVKGKAEFYQMVSVKSEDQVLKGFLTFMACDDSKCLPPSDVNFEITIK